MAAAASPTSPLNKIERAHQMYRDGRHEEALGFYTEALFMAKTKAQKIALHSNRAACYLKLHNFKKAAEECTLVLELDQNHTGALMLRAQTLVTLKDYHSALFDVNRLMELNPSSDVYQNLHARLKTQLLLAPIPECEEESWMSELEDEEEREEQEEQEEEEEDDEEKGDEEEETMVSFADQKSEDLRTIPTQLSVSSQIKSLQDLSEKQLNQCKEMPNVPILQLPAISQTKSLKDSSDMISNQCKEIPKKHIPQPPISSQTKSLRDSDTHLSRLKEVPKPKGHSKLDYSRWDQVEDDSSEEEDEDEESMPQYRFRVRTVGVRPVK